MRRIPSFLPHRHPVWNPSHVAFGAGWKEQPIPVSPTWMELVAFNSPAMIHGMLMTEIISPETNEVERTFFGYKCLVCEDIVLVSNYARDEHSLGECLRHKCEASELRRAVRNARRLGLEKDEQIMETPNGGWYPQRRDRYATDYYSPFTNDYVYSREQVSTMYRRGDISHDRAEEMLRMRYETRDRKIDYTK